MAWFSREARERRRAERRQRELGAAKVRYLRAQAGVAKAVEKERRAGARYLIAQGGAGGEQVQEVRPKGRPVRVRRSRRARQHRRSRPGARKGSGAARRRFLGGAE